MRYKSSGSYGYGSDQAIQCPDSHFISRTGNNASHHEKVDLSATCLAHRETCLTYCICTNFRLELTFAIFVRGTKINN